MMTTTHDRLKGLGRWLRSPYAVLVAFLLLGAVSFAGFYRADRNAAAIESQAEQRANELVEQAEQRAAELVELAEQRAAELAEQGELRAQLACEGATDVRQVVAELIKFSGQQQLVPDNYRGELRRAIVKFNRKGARFRERMTGRLEIPPPQCEGRDGTTNDDGG